MNLTIVTFLVLGTCFGLASFSSRHLFSEGPCKAEDLKTSHSTGSWIFWVLMCTLLWPVMVVTGINTAVVLVKRRSARGK
jgi:hypothetical protein